MPLLTVPLALLGLASLPAAVAIYWLRNRLRRQEVSSLHLWLGQREAREGGQRVQKLQIPWLLLLELLALLLLVLAATDPRVLMGQQQRQLVVVLDDSYSMQAGGRQRAMQLLTNQLEDESPLAVRLVLARQSPVVLSSLLTSMTAVEEALPGWRCEAQFADLGQAISLAYELGGNEGRVLVLTDQPPTTAAPQPRLVWQAVGEASPNVAIINAVRDAQAGSQRALVEVANLSDEPASPTLRVNSQPRQLQLAPQEVARLWVDIPNPSASVLFELSDDALPADNRALLLPDQRTQVKVQLNVGDETLAALLRRAVSASSMGEVVASGGDLLMTDQDTQGISTPARWLVHWRVEEDAQAFVGPFLMDRQHPLADGLELEGVVWGAAQTEDMSGRAVVTAGNTPLVSFVDRSGLRGAQYDIIVRLNPELSTVGTTPAFPVLVWNMFAWRQANLPGLSQSNVRAGASVRFTPVRAGAALAGVTQEVDANDPAVTQALTPKVTIIGPDGSEQQVDVHAQSIQIPTHQPGVYEIVSGDRRYELAANVMSQQESDLSSHRTQSLGQWTTASTLREEYTSIAWVILLGLFGVLGLHSLLAWRSGGGGG